MSGLIGFFSGAGMLERGLTNAGLDVRLGIELDPVACKSYKRLVGDVLEADLSTLEMATLPACDVLVGGPPCQGFSSAGLRDPNDPRNQLWREMVRYAAAKLPPLVMIENVRGLVSSGTHLDIEQQFRALGYNFQWRILNAANYGTPQHRRRVIMVAYAYGVRWQWPLPTHRVVPDMFTSSLVPVDGCLDLALPYGWNPEGVAVKKRSGDSGRTSYPPFLLGRPGLTVKAHYPAVGCNWLRVGNQFRGLKLKEAWRIQGFDDATFGCLAGNVEERWRQIGNGVPRQLAEALGRSIKQALS